MSKFNLIYLIISFSIYNIINGKIASVFIDEHRKITLFDNISSNRFASGIYQNDMNTTGWSYLEIDTVPGVDDRLQAYSAGYIEGALTRDMIVLHWHNTYKGFCTQPLSGFCLRLQQFIDDNLKWTRMMIERHAKTDNYWHQVQLFLDQMMGVYDGFYANTVHSDDYKIDVTDINLMQISGDVETLATVLGGELHMQKHQSVPGNGRIVGSGHCSALIRLLDNNEDIYTGQDTWTGYNSMLRILKKYSFQYANITDGSMISGNKVTFSSSGASITSGDDFYVVKSGLTVMETTIGNSNALRWKYVTPQNLLQGIRNVVANRLARSGEEWCTIFSRYNMGTYNNEWMVVDYGRFRSGAQSLAPGTLFVLDQIPGKITFKDLTTLLEEKRYFASYNSPHFPDIFNASGWVEQVNKMGDWFDHNKTPRARIFRRDQSKVNNLQTMATMMRYNDFKNDPLSRCNCTPPYSGENSIAARCDLNPADGVYPFSALGQRNHGAIDFKITSLAMSKNLEFLSAAGPTFDNLPAFDWSTSEYRDSVPHLGHPVRWQFKPIVHQWKP